MALDNLFRDRLRQASGLARKLGISTEFGSTVADGVEMWQIPGTPYFHTRQVIKLDVEVPEPNGYEFVAFLLQLSTGPNTIRQTLSSRIVARKEVPTEFENRHECMVCHRSWQEGDWYLFRHVPSGDWHQVCRRCTKHVIGELDPTTFYSYYIALDNLLDQADYDRNAHKEPGVVRITDYLAWVIASARVGSYTSIASQNSRDKDRLADEARKSQLAQAKLTWSNMMSQKDTDPGHPDQILPTSEDYAEAYRVAQFVTDNPKVIDDYDIWHTFQSEYTDLRNTKLVARAYQHYVRYLGDQRYNGAVGKPGDRIELDIELMRVARTQHPQTGETRLVHTFRVLSDGAEVRWARPAAMYSFVPSGSKVTIACTVINAAERDGVMITVVRDVKLVGYPF
jgi:hypothetical protein